jgi:hypothetical protein
VSSSQCRLKVVRVSSGLVADGFLCLAHRASEHCPAPGHNGSRVGGSHYPTDVVAEGVR